MVAITKIPLAVLIPIWHTLPHIHVTMFPGLAPRLPRLYIQEDVITSVQLDLPSVSRKRIVGIFQVFMVVPREVPSGSYILEVSIYPLRL
jgi:hypothetical protein